MHRLNQIKQMLGLYRARSHDLTRKRIEFILQLLNQSIFDVHSVVGTHLGQYRMR